MSQEENQSSERFLGLDEERFEQYEIFISFLQEMDSMLCNNSMRSFARMC
tara:strand:- start:199 stop:348 length:150 start_codon:yes stop_codon:yes gene_type:complete